MPQGRHRLVKSESELKKWIRLSVATVTSTAMVGGVLVAAPAHPLNPMVGTAAAQEVPSEQALAYASGQALDLSLFLGLTTDDASRENLLTVIETIEASQEWPNDATGPDTGTISLSLLEEIDIALTNTLTLPLFKTPGQTDGLLELGDLGLLGAYASTPSASEAHAAAGVLTDSGTINLSAHEPTGSVDTTLDVTDLLADANLDGLTNDIVSELSLRLGAVSSSAQRNGDTVTSEYAIANADLHLTSPLVGDLTSALGELGADFDTTVAGLAGDPGTGLVNEVLGGLSGLIEIVKGIPVVGPLLTVLVGDISLNEPQVTLTSNLEGTINALLTGTKTSSDELVEINLETGEVTVNLEKLGAIDQAEPNTNLLNETATTQITDALRSILEGLLEDVSTAVEGGLGETSVTVNVELIHTPLLGTSNTVGQVALSGSLNDFLEGTANADVIVSGTEAPSLGTALQGTLKLVGEAVKLVVDEVADPVVNDVLPGLSTRLVVPLVDVLGEILTDVVRIKINDQTNQQVVSEITRNPSRLNEATAPVTTPGGLSPSARCVSTFSTVWWTSRWPRPLSMPCLP